MLQLKIVVPALAVPEAVTYVNLLLAELHLPAEDFARLRDHVAAQRVTDSLGVAFNLGTLGDLGLAVPSGLSADLQWAAAIAPVLAGGSRGNPRQVKRFLNTLQLRRRAAEPQERVAGTRGARQAHAAGRPALQRVPAAVRLAGCQRRAVLPAARGSRGARPRR